LQGDSEVKQGEEGLSNKLGDLYFTKFYMIFVFNFFDGVTPEVL
jgi:hypothetical protein